MSIKETIRAEIRQRIKKYGKLADAAWGKDDPFAAETNENIVSELQSLIVFTYTLPEQPMMCSKDDYHWEGLKELLRDYQKTIDRQHNNMAYESVELYIDWIDSLFEQPASDCRETCKGYQETGKCFVDGPFVAKQPASEGLEEEISSYWNRVTGFQPKFAVLELTKEELAKVARHFAEWGANHKNQ